MFKLILGMFVAIILFILKVTEKPIKLLIKRWEKKSIERIIKLRCANK